MKTISNFTFTIFLTLFTVVLPAQNPDAFITTWQVNNGGSILIPVNPYVSGYNYTVDWGDGNTTSGHTGDASHTYATAGTYTVSITGNFPAIQFGSPTSNDSNDEKLRTIEQWGTQVWQGMDKAFHGCSNLTTESDTDAPVFAPNSTLFSMFLRCSNFNSDLNDWDLSNVIETKYMFESAAAFNGAISNWDVKNVTSMQSMFRGASSFNQYIGNWDVSKVIYMDWMFKFASSFNQDIGDWKVFNVKNMSGMFAFASQFNQDLGSWTVSKVENMSFMFQHAEQFNQDIGGWNVSMVTQMANMFDGASEFNGDIGSWTVANVTNMEFMFYSATNFDQDIGEWNVSKVTNMTSMLGNSGLSTPHYDNTLTGWAAQTVEPNVTLGAQNLKYCAAVDERQSLIDDHGWTISGDAIESPTCTPPDLDAFITTWQVNNGGSILIPVNPYVSGYNYTVDWGDGTTTSGHTEDASHTYATAGTYTVSITGNFPAIQFGSPTSNDSNDEKLRTIEQWGTQVWQGMDKAFHGCSNLTTESDTDAPVFAPNSTLFSMFSGCTNFNSDLNDWDLINVWETSFMFANATAFNGAISNWNTSNVTNMQSMFYNAKKFDQIIGDWNVSKVTYMFDMFAYASEFNQNIGSWDVSSVTNMSHMFALASLFNQDISNWSVSNVTHMNAMFYKARSFNQDIGAWDITNVTDMGTMLSLANLSTSNYDNTLIGWAAQNVQSNVSLNADGLTYCGAVDERQSLIDDHGWIISGDAVESPACTAAPEDAFITTWQVNNGGSILIPVNPDVSGYNYTVDWGDGNTTSGHTGDASHTYATAGTYTVSITGNFPAIQFGSPTSNDSNDEKLRTIEQWGTQVWQGMNKAFQGCSNLTTESDTDAPVFAPNSTLFSMFSGCTNFNSDLNDWDLINVWETSFMFDNATKFNGNISNWNTSNVTNMQWMFSHAESFNQDIGNWDVSNVIYMDRMFYDAFKFNQDLGSWNVSNVTNMVAMFRSASEFNRYIGDWNVLNVTDMPRMFLNASKFDQNIGDWNVSNVTDMTDLLSFSGLSTANYDNTLTGWSAQAVQSNITLGANGLTYCAAVDERQSLIDDHGWSISGDALENTNCTAMRVYITTEQGDTLTIQAGSTDAIQQLKMRIQDQIGVPPDQQRLTFNNQILEPGRTLAEYSIADEDILHLVVMSIPVMTCPDKVIESCDAIVTFDLPEASSTWGSLSVVQTDNTGLTSGSVFPTGITTLTYRASNAAGAATCFIEVEVLPDLSIAHTSGVQNGDTLHLAQCLPPAITKEDLELGPHQNRSSLRSTIYSQPLPPKDERPAGLWKVLLYAYEVSDQCGHRETFQYYVALYDLEPPVFRNFPQDTMVNGPEDLPSVAEDVRIIDICRYVVWDTVTTAPVLDYGSGDTLAFVRRWMAEDEVGNKSFRDQMIYLRPAPRADLNSITVHIVKEKDLIDGRFLETTGTLGVPVTLYHIDDSGTSVAIDARQSGRWQGQYGSVFFTPILSGSYRLKMDLPDGYAAVHPDSLIHADGWSDTLTLSGDSTLDIGTILLVRDTISEDQPIVLEQSASDQSITARGLDFKVYPNPSAGWIKVMLPETGTYDFTIFNRLGQSVKTGTIEHGMEIDLTSQKDGMYFIRVEKEQVYSETKAVLLFTE